MKKLLLKILLMMLLSMGLVFAISRIALFVMQFDGEIDPKHMYYISLIAGLCGLALFVLLLNLFVIKRLKRLATGVEAVTKGNYLVTVSDKGHDELQTLIASFNSMAKELRANEFCSREYVKNVSHELKTPLSSILGFAELLENPNVSEKEKQEYAHIIYEEALRLTKLGGQMLDISRLDSHVILKEEDCFNPAEQIRNVILLMQNEWQSKNITFSVEMEDCLITSNAELVRHIWQNLIANAVRYCNTNGSITVKLAQNSRLQFSIANTGDGILEEDQPHIFEQFYTADKSKSKGGSGLGLALTKKIVDKLCGSISFTSNSELTTFVVTLTGL